MYGIDKLASFNFLIGKEILQLCIGLYQVILNFSDQVVITAECTIRFKKSDGSTVEFSCDNPELSSELTCLLGCIVEAIDTETYGELTLIFSKGLVLTIIDSNEEEESFTITTKDQEVIV